MPNFFLSYKRAKVAGRTSAARERQSRAGFEADAPRYGQRTAGFSDEVAAGDQQSGKNAQGLGALAGATAMKLFTTWVVSAGLVLAATAADAQVLAPRGTGSAGYAAVSDVDGPYAAVPEGAPVPGYGPTLLPAPEVYTVLRENGFSPLGAPQLRGVVYTIAVMDRRGDDGRLVINARNGRIIRFMPAYRRGGNFNDDLSMTDGTVGSLPPVSQVRGAPRPPLSIPRVASRTPSVPMPKASPPRRSEEHTS